MRSRSPLSPWTSTPAPRPRLLVVEDDVALADAGPVVGEPGAHAVVELFCGEVVGDAVVVKGVAKDEVIAYPPLNPPP